MANLNKVMLIGRLTRDPEMRTFANGGKIANIGFAVNNRKKNQQTGEWEDEPVFIDIKAANRENGRKLADLVEQYLKKGNQVYIEGNLVLDQWVDKNDGQKRSKLRVNMTDLQFLEPRADGAAGEGGFRSQRPAAAAPRRAETVASNGGGNYSDFGNEAEPMEPPAGGGEDDIPF
jgi:single-strand DNA-binding protein